MSITIFVHHLPGAGIDPFHRRSISLHPLALVMDSYNALIGFRHELNIPSFVLWFVGDAGNKEDDE
jgi:hypothetical protein